MALVDIISFHVRDFDNSKKSIPFFIPAGSELADIQAFIDDVAGDINLVTGLVIDEVVLERRMTLPAGLATTPVSGVEAQRGANLKYTADDTTYTYSLWVPGWLTAGFSDQSVLNTGVFAAFIAKLYDTYGTGEMPLTDENGNNLVAYVSGKKSFRK